MPEHHDLKWLLLHDYLRSKQQWRLHQDELVCLHPTPNSDSNTDVHADTRAHAHTDTDTDIDTNTDSDANPNSDALANADKVTNTN